MGITKHSPTCGGDPKTYPSISITPYLCSVYWEWQQWDGSKGSELGVRGSKLGVSLAQTEVVVTQKLASQVVGTQNIPLDLHYALPLLIPLGVGGEQTGSKGRDPWPKRGGGHPKTCSYKWWGPPKHTPWSPLCPTSAQSIGSVGSKLGARGGTLSPTEVVATLKLGPTGGGHPKIYPSISIMPYLHSVH